MNRGSPDLPVSLARLWDDHYRFREHMSSTDRLRWWHIAAWLAASLASGPLAAQFADLAATWL